MLHQSCFLACYSVTVKINWSFNFYRNVCLNFSRLTLRNPWDRNIKRLTYFCATNSLGAESITLYVATNQKKSGQYRLWRQTADGSNEWSNKYALSAFIKPTGNFTYPMYVFAAGGSPHWRQYVSDKSSPPSPEYRLDYMFYCSQTFLPGTLQYHVLEAGSVPVIRSYVSRTNSVPGWRHNGLSFYAPKSTLVSDKTREYWELLKHS